MRLQVRIIEKTWADHNDRLQTQLANRNAEARKIKDNQTAVAKRREKFEAEKDPDSEQSVVNTALICKQAHALAARSASSLAPYELRSFALSIVFQES